MAKNSIRDYDATAANNTDVQSTDISEGCAASGINNAIREVMADLKDVSTGTIALETPAADRLDVDNLRLDGNTISSTDTNGDITLDPNGTGDVVVSGATLTATTTDNFPITWQGASGGATGALYGDGSAVGMFNGAAFTTGVWANTSNEVYIRNNGSNTVKIDSSGNVTQSSGTFTIKNGGGDSNGLKILQDTSDTSKIINHFGGPMVFGTNNTERMRIDSSGRLLVGTTSTVIDDSPLVHVVADQAANFQATVSTGGGTVLNVDRANADGALIRFRQAGTTEGTISVSGSTVSYNGGHLSRWSQLADGTEDLTIVKGTVMTNLDQMAVWSHDEVLWTADDDLPDGVSVGDVKTAAFTEDNEQLNCMAVSSVEGDANVAGVFVNWDNHDDDFNDMNVAMTGDMVIRIASGTTVARGDLLMSAGDGTAKPQGDDIVRSKTIAKVTSTTVSHTYDDGSYLVPCVLMAC